MLGRDRLPGLRAPAVAVASPTGTRSLGGCTLPKQHATPSRPPPARWPRPTLYSFYRPRTPHNSRLRAKCSAAGRTSHTTRCSPPMPTGTHHICREHIQESVTLPARTAPWPLCTIPVPSVKCPLSLEPVSVYDGPYFLIFPVSLSPALVLPLTGPPC